MTDYVPYWQLLRDPRWQRKRLEIMERAGFQCEECRAADKTLNVHHTHYVKGRKPWEYQNTDLRCLCEDCHGATTERIGEISRRIGGQSPEVLDQIVGYVRCQELINSSDEDPDRQLLVFNYEQAIGVANAFGIRSVNYGYEKILEHAEGNGRCVSFARLMEIWTETQRGPNG